MRMNWAALAVILCYAVAPADATCDPRDQLSPLNEPEWTLVGSGSTTSRVLVTPSSMQSTDATIVLSARLAADDRRAENMEPVASLPSTATAPEPRLLMVCLGFFLTVAGAAMLLLPRR